MYGRQIRCTLFREPRRSDYGHEVTDATLPGKASKLQVTKNRTPNQHWWSGREYQGAWENSGEGTRQNSTVTSGEGTLLLVKEFTSGASGSRSDQVAGTV